MPKVLKKKKRRKIHDVSQLSGLSNITGFDDSLGGSSLLEDCMAEMIFQGQEVSTKDSDQSDKPQHTERPRKRKQPSWMQQANSDQTSTMMSSEDIDNWNRSFKVWANGGVYEPGLLPNIDQELARNFKVKELSTLLLKHKEFSEKDLRMPVFERWLLDSKNEETLDGVQGDSVLPIRSSPHSQASQRLLAELTKNKIGKAQAEEIIAKLCRTTNLACQELVSQDDRYRRQSPLKKGDRIRMSKKTSSTNDVVNIEYSRKKWKKPFCFKINQKHYQNLKDRFLEIHPDLWLDSKQTMKNEFDTVIERSFHVLVIALLLRYSALSGGDLLDDLRGGGMQGAIHAGVFEALQTHFSTGSSNDKHWFEGFASPFNATLPRFASAFPDLDWHFGSVGRFLDCNFDSSSDEEFCEANPPFSPGIMSSMANHMMKAIDRAKANKRKLTFVVVVPSAGCKSPSKKANHSKSVNPNEGTAVAKSAAGQSFRAMTSSEYCTKHIQLNAREHGYVEGSQHLRPTQFKQSSYDTSVIILQSPEASRTDLRILEKDVRNAFASRHEIELRERKRKATENT